MFWRVLWKLFRATPRRKLTREFRALGANVIVSPLREARAAGNESPLMSESVYRRIAALRSARVVAAAPYLYLVAPAPAGNAPQPRGVVAGTLVDEGGRKAPWGEI